MTEMTLYNFLSGAVALGFAVCALFFLRFWYRTREYLFFAFASAFALLGIGQSILTLADIPAENRSYMFLFRLAAFTLIIIAIFRKNRGNAES